MASYNIVFKDSVRKDLKKTDRAIIVKILRAIERLKDNPFPAQSKKLKISEFTHRLRVGDFRILYQVNTSNLLITVSHIRHRKDAYRNL